MQSISFGFKSIMDCMLIINFSVILRGFQKIAANYRINGVRSGYHTKGSMLYGTGLTNILSI